MKPLHGFSVVTTKMTLKWDSWFRQEASIALREFDKREFYRWGYSGNSRVIFDFFEMYQMGGEL